MTQKKESALGRGLDALIRMEPEEEKSEEPQKSSEKPRSRASNPKTSKRKSTPTKQRSSKKSKAEIQDNSIQEDLVDSVIVEVNKNPRISLWSAKSAAVLRLLKKTKPEFSISKEASALIEDAVKDKYPELWEVFEDKNI
ncbi:MAG: AAA family ATPase [Methanobacterium sp. ERen5]|nr:MAG: AAA family ATPase [Methanobacterium sp. ERen5]